MANIFDANDLRIVAELKKELRALKKELLDIAKNVRTAQSAMSQQSKTQAELNTKTKAVTNSTRRLSELQRERARVAQQTRRVFAQSLALEERGTRQLILGQERLREARRQAREEARRQLNINRQSGNFFKNLSKTLLSAGAAFVSVGAAISAFTRLVTNAIKVNREFEKTISNVITLLDQSQIDKYGDFIKQGAIDIAAKYGLEIADVNKALFDAISAGVDVGESINFLSKNAELAIGGVTSLTTAVDGVTSVMNAYGLQASEVDNVTSAFFSAQKFGKTTVEELSASIGKTAPIAKQAGVGYRELLSAFAELTKQGISTDETATAIKATLTGLLKPSAEAAVVFEQLGIEYGATALQSNGLFKTLGQVSAAAEGNADVLSTLIPNVRALTGVGALGTKQLAEMDDILQILNSDFGEGSSLQNAFNTQSETGAAQSAKLKAEYQKMLVTLGGGESIFKKIGNSIRSGLTDRIQNVTKSIQAFKEGTLVDKLKVIGNSITRLLIGPFNYLVKIIEKLTGKDFGFKFETKTAEDKINETVDIVKQGETEITEAQKEEEAKRAEIRRKAAELRKEEEEKEYQDRLKRRKERLKRELDNDLKSVIDKGKKETKKYEEQIKSENELFDEWLDYQLESEYDVTDKLQEESDARLKIYKKEAEERAKIKKAEQETLNQIESAAITILSDQFNASIDNDLDNYIETNEAKQESLKAQLENGKIDEAEYERQIKQLRQKARTEEAKAEKKKALYQIGLDVLKGVVKAIAESPKTFGLPFSAYVLAQGAIQAAAVAARPIPKFGYGSGGALSNDTFAQIGDRYQHELVTMPDGSIFFSDNKPQNVLLPAGAEVFSGEKTKQIAQSNGYDSFFIKQLLIGQKEQTKQIKRIASTNSTDKGIIKEGDNYRNRYVK